jgi:hypothetical protein
MNPKVYLVLLESNCWIRFNEIYFIIFILEVWKILNFVVENSNKLQQIGFRRENELNVFTLGSNNTCYLIYPWRKVVCFVLSLWYFPNHGVLGYVMELIIKKFSMNRGATTWFRMFRATMWYLLIIEAFFHLIFWKTKIENYIGIWGCYWYCWKALTKFDLIKLIS